MEFSHRLRTRGTLSLKISTISQPAFTLPPQNTPRHQTAAMSRTAFAGACLFALLALGSAATTKEGQAFLTEKEACSFCPSLSLPPPPPTAHKACSAALLRSTQGNCIIDDV